MSGKFSKLGNTAWEKFVSTGSIYDYLEYKSNNELLKNSTGEAIFTDDYGGFCENRSKRDSDKRN